MNLLERLKEIDEKYDQSNLLSDRPMFQIVPLEYQPKKGQSEATIHHLYEFKDVINKILDRFSVVAVLGGKIEG